MVFNFILIKILIFIIMLKIYNTCLSKFIDLYLKKTRSQGICVYIHWCHSFTNHWNAQCYCITKFRFTDYTNAFYYIADSKKKKYKKSKNICLNICTKFDRVGAWMIKSFYCNTFEGYMYWTWLVLPTILYKYLNSLKYEHSASLTVQQRNCNILKDVQNTTSSKCYS